jgi:adenylate cyclase, class 2
VVRPERLELPAYWFEASRSIQLSYGRTSLNTAKYTRVYHPIRYPDRVKPLVEVEIKLRAGTAARARALLRRHGFEIVSARVFEQNLVLDDERASLRMGGMLLRVRAAGKIVTCTFKSPEQPGRHKRRGEREFRASDFDACIGIFEALGYREKFRYEKYRTEFRRGRERGHVTVDETPIGVFMELEGPARWIDRTAKTLGFAAADYVMESYARLHEAWRAAHGLEPGDMRFAAGAANRRR